VLHEGASKLVERLIPGERAEDYDNALQEAQRYLHSHGIVGWQDAMVLRPGPGAASYEAYRRGQRDGWLTARVVAALWWDRHITSAGVTDAVASLVEARDAAADGTRYTAGTVKIMLDGVVETQTASVLQPYTDGCGCPTENAGLSFIEPDLLNEIVTQLDRAGFQVHFHALGDRAVRDALDAVEIAQAANRTGDRRHHIAHLQLISPDDMPRFRRLGVAANIQGLWATRDPETDAITFPALGSTRGEQQFPFGPLLNDGATLVMGSDWPVSSPEPMAAVHALVNRVAYDAPRGTQPLGEVHRLPLTTALAAYTAGSAWINGDAQGGSIVVGNRADLVVLDRDPFELPAEEIGGIKVVQTYVSGALVAEN
jgi:predicted amidohydrolase YtcJ